MEMSGEGVEMSGEGVEMNGKGVEACCEDGLERLPLMVVMGEGAWAGGAGGKGT